MLDKLDPEKQKLLLFAIVAVIILYVEIGIVFKFQSQGVKDAGARIVKLEKDISAFKSDLANMQNAKQVPGKEKQKAKYLVSEQSLGSLWQNISDLADKNRIKITQMKPVKGKDEVVSGIKCVGYTVSVDLSCGYHSLGSFINALENAEQFMAVQDLKITGNPNEYFSQPVVLILKIYARK